MRLVLAPPEGEVGSDNEIAPDGETEYCATMLPTSKVFAPAMVTTSEMGALGCTELSKSAQRPPHPVNGGWSGTEVCHWVCWSACEKSCGGGGGGTGQVLRARDGVNQRARIEHKRELPGPK